MRLMKIDGLFDDFMELLKESNLSGYDKVLMGLDLLLIFWDDDKKALVKWCAELAKGLPEKEDE